MRKTMSAHTSRRSLIISAAALPALAVPTVAGAAVNHDLLVLGERLRVLLPKARALGVKLRQLTEESRADLPTGFMIKENFRRIYEIRSEKNGRGRARDEWADASTEVDEIAEAKSGRPIVSAKVSAPRPCSLLMNPIARTVSTCARCCGKWQSEPASCALNVARFGRD
jgi:hypothetical protein